MGFKRRVDSLTLFRQETVTAELRIATEGLEIEGLIVTARSRFGRTSLAAAAKGADFITREERSSHSCRGSGTRATSCATEAWSEDEAEGRRVGGDVPWFG